MCQRLQRPYEDTMDEPMIVGEIKHSGFTVQKRAIYSESGISPPLLASGYKDPIKILVEKDEKDE